MKTVHSTIARSTAVLAVLAATACGGYSTAVGLRSSTTSPFQGALYKGQETVIRKTPDGADEYRVFVQGESGFVPLESVRSDAEARASAFCKGLDRRMTLLRETSSVPPHVLGNYPRIEVVFACEDVDSDTGRVAQQTHPIATTSTGTGFAVNDPFTVATAYHVIDGASSVVVVCANGQQSTAKIDNSDPPNDLAVLRIQSPAPYFLELAANNSVALGQRVFTVGFPVPDLLGMSAKYSDGTVSSLTGLFGATSLLQISVPIQPGNSGGPLINEKGEVIGVVTSTAAVAAFAERTGTIPQNVNWSVRSEYLKFMLSPQKKDPSREILEPIEAAKQSVCLIVATRGK